MSTTTASIPLSVGQEAMWIAWKVDPGQWSHIIPTPFQVRGTLDLGRLRRAVAEIGRAYPQLRGRVSSESDGGLTLDWSDAPEIPVRETHTTLDRDTAVRQCWQVPFDLREGPLARVDLLHGPDYTVLLIAAHHLVYDGASVLLLLDSLRAAYAGEELPFHDQAPALAAFAERSRELADGPAGEEHRAYWKTALSGGTTAFSLPASHEEPQYTVFSERLPAELAVALRERAAGLGISYVTVLLGGYFALLGEYGGAEDVLAFLPYHGRTLPELGDRVGYFVNALPVRAEVRADDRFRDLLDRVRGRVKDVLGHGELPLPAIMRAAGLTGPDARRRTHQTVFQFWHAGLRDGVDVQDLRLRADGDEASLALLDMESSAGFALALMVREDSAGTHLLWKDPVGAVGPANVRAMAADYLRVLRAIADDPDARLSGVVRGAGVSAALPSAGPAADESTHESAGASLAASGLPDGDARVARMAEVWQDILGSGPVHAQDSFFELGGHSLLAETLVLAVTRRFGGPASIRMLFEHPRLADFTAQAVPAAEAGPTTAATVPAVAPAPDTDTGTGTGTGTGTDKHVTRPIDTFPASSFQRRIWLAERVAEDPAAYNVPLAWRTDTPLDATSVRAALAAAVARHEMLRTAFHEVDGELMQTVREPWAPEVTRVDLSDRPDPEQALRDWLRSASHERFDLASGRLLTAALVELGAGGQVLFVCLHHLLWDGECETLLLRELDTNYAEAPSSATGSTSPSGSGRRSHPASAHQERMWFVDRFESGHLYPGSPTYHNLPLYLRLDRLPDHGLLARSLHAVVGAHEALRTELTDVNGRAAQRIRPEVTAVPQWLPAVAAQDGAEVPPALAEWAAAPFELGDGPLLRLAVLPQDGTAGGWLALCGHQAVVDITSLRLIGEQVLAGLSGTAPRPSSYREWLEAGDPDVRKRDLTERGAVLEPVPDPVRLPERRTRAAIHVYEERSVSFDLPAGLALRETAERLGTGVPEVTLAAFAALLHWYTGQEDMVLGLSHPGRTDADQDVVGPLGNLLPVRLRPRARRSFAELVADTAAETAHAREHDRAPFDELVRLVNPAKDMSRTALFDVLYSYLPAASPVSGRDGITAQPVDTAGGRGKYDLHLCLQPRDGGHRGHLVYNGLYFDPDQISAMAVHYEAMLRQLTERPDREVSDTDPLTPDERTTQLVRWNSTGAGYEETPVHELIRRQALARPGAVALTDGGTRIGYAELLADAEAVARGLVEAGVRPGELVALLFPRGADQVRAILGTLLAGAAYLPVDPAVPAQRREFILADSGVRLAVVPGRDAGALPGGSEFSGRVLPLAGLLDGERPADSVTLPSVPLDSAAYCIYTSGTTGRPKGVVITHRNLARLLDNDRMPFSFGPSDVWTMFHSYAFDFSVWELFGALVHGGRVVLVSEDETRDPRLFFELVQRERVTVLNQTPSAFRRLLRLEPSSPDGLSALRYVVFGGEALQPAMLSAWSERHPQVRLVNMYGITETTVHASVRTVTRTDMAADTSVVGVPIPTTRLLLLDRHTGRRLLPVGAVGEIYVGGAGVAGGYLHRPELTAERFVPSPFADGTLFRSGDLAAYLPDGNLRFIGRADSQVQLRGYRIEPGEVQTCLTEHPDVADAVVFVEDDRLVAVVQSAREMTARELRGVLAGRLPSYMLPSLFHVVPRIPLTANGKVDLTALRAETAGLGDAGRTAPRSATAVALASVWCEVLGVPSVGDEDSFFALGGHSMLAVRLVGEIAERFGADLPIKTLFETPRLGDLAALIDAVTGHRTDRRTAGLRTTPEPAPTTLPAPVTAAAPVLSPSAAGAPVAAGEAGPASAFQRRMWLAEQAGGGSGGNVFLGWTVTGRVDPAVLEEALARVVAGHEILRTAFRPRAGTIRQVVLEPWRPGVEAFAPQDADSAGEAATRWLDAAAGQPFDLGSGRLLRAAVADLGPRGQAVMLCLHHLVIDGESIPVLLRELRRCYEDALAGVPSAPPSSQYRAYTAALEAADPARRAVELDFWQDRLAGLPARLDLPAPVRAGENGAVRVPLPAGLLGRLRPVMAEHGATWFTLVAAALSVELHTWTGRSTLTFGVPAAVRGPEFAGLLGPCLNTVVLRSRQAPGGTVRDALDAMRTEVLDAFEHAGTPFDEVLERLKPDHVPGRAPYTDVVLNMNLRGDRRTLLGDAELRPLFAESLWKHEAKFGLTLTVAEEDGELSAVLSYQGDRVAPADAEALAAAVATSLTGLAAGARPAQYRDFVAAQEAFRNGPGHEADLSYWQEQLAGAPVYTDFPVPEREAPHGVVDVVVPAGTGDRLRALQDQCGVSPFMTVATALAIVLHRRTHGDDTVVSTPLTNRGRPGLAEVFGPLLNTVTLRSRFVPGMTVRDALTATRDATLEAFAHGETPFEDVVARLNPQRRPGRTPYADVSLAFATAASRPATLGGRTLRAVEIDGEGAAFTGKLGMTVALTLDGSRLHGRIAYHGGRFRRSDIEQTAHTLGTLLGRIPDSLDVEVDRFDLLTPEESARIRAWETGPEPAAVATVPALLLEQARIRPDAPAIESGRGTLGYRALVERARRVAGAVRPLLPESEPVVALLLERGEDFVVGMLAAWFAGAAFCPLDPSWPTARQEFVLEDVRAAVLLTAPGLPRPAASGAVVVEVTDLPEDPESIESDTASDWSPEATAYVIYTSGTTGRPKGVVVRHGGIANLARSTGATQGIGPDDRCTHLLSVGFDSSQMEVWQALVNGACLVPHEETVSASTLGNWIDGRRATVAFLTTSLAEAVWSAGSAPRGLRWMGIGGAALSQRPPADLPYRLLNSYGPTENTVASSEQVMTARDDAPLNCIGQPIAGVRMLVLDALGRRCPVGVDGEIHLAGASLAAEYLRRPELTAERFTTVELDGAPLRVYRSGDLGRRLADGRVEYLGRADRQLKIRGYRVEPGEIEHFLLRQPEVELAAVTGDPRRTPSLVAYVVPAVGQRPDTGGLLERARAELPAFMVPEAVVVLPTLPLTTSGKVDHAALPEPGRTDLVGAAGFTAPGNGTERRVAALWSDVLGLPEVGVHDNFFDLGGNSLVLAKLHSRLVVAFGRDIPITLLFEHTTVSSLARALSPENGPASQPGASRRSRAAGRQARRDRRRGNGTEGA
ncbi:amino acid adenylation domain-containing protein [Streptomyces sp. NPDC086182]|uniref:amino acid adenylation domain-containing protein n=1 Tax=Streptomyces sp. NPDC086182 TaxID=3155058 RepID=UPI003431EE9C